MKRTIAALAFALPVLLAPTAAQAAPAPERPGAVQPRGGCTGPLCSVITNETSQTVGTAKDWCDRQNGPCPNTQYGLLHKNETTPKGDWDTFFVAFNCTYSGEKHAWGGKFSVNGGRDGKWVQVHNDEHYYIKKITC
jgi:hypothetical protein